MKRTPIPNAAATRTCTYTVSTISSPRRFTSSSAPGCGPEAVATAPVTTSAAQAGIPIQVTNRRSQPGPAGRGEASGVAPRLEHDHHRQREHDQREQEVRHHRERVEVEGDRDRAQRNLRDGERETRDSAARRTPRGRPTTLRAPNQVTSVSARPTRATMRFPNSTNAWNPCSG